MNRPRVLLFFLTEGKDQSEEDSLEEYWGIKKREVTVALLEDRH